MSLQTGAERVVQQCLSINSNEQVVVVNDGNDQELIDALRQEIQKVGAGETYMEYKEPERHGIEPPEKVARALLDSDVFVAPTLKSISHTRARVNACEAGSRGATLPGINREIWNTSLQADYFEVERISNIVYEQLKDTSRVHVVTPSGSDFSFDVHIEYFHRDTGMIHEPGDFGNLPAGEADGPAIHLNGTLVIDHFQWAPRGMKVHIEDSNVVDYDSPEPGETSELQEAFEQVYGARNVAEFGFGTNPEATLIGNLLQDEKVLGTVHVAFGDNSSYLSEDHPEYVSCDVHWDSVCEKPTVRFDDCLMLEDGKPVFLEEG